MPKIAFYFPGQGAQAVGIASALVATLPAAKALFDQAEAILGYNLLDLCINGPVEKLNATDISQPAIYTASLAALESLKATEPAIVESVEAAAGLSLGEYTALTFAGAMSFEEGLRVVSARGQAMQAAAEATPSGMVSIIGLEAAEVESLVAEARASSGKLLEVANLLCPGNTVVSGDNAAIDALVSLAESRNLRAIKLAVAGAFHTNLMKPADEKLAQVLAGVSLKSPRIPVWSNVDAQPHTDPQEIRDLLVKQVLAPVQWEATMRGMQAVGFDKFYEIGPGRVLAGLMKRVNRKADLTNITV
ncbi:MAG: ACP S-malonyltransferase [Fimbriiglobus sp.]